MQDDAKMKTARVSGKVIDEWTVKKMRSDVQQEQGIRRKKSKGDVMDGEKHASRLLRRCGTFIQIVIDSWTKIVQRG